MRIFWTLMLSGILYLAGYLTGKENAPVVEKVYYLTGKNDPLCGLKGRKM